MCKHCYIDISTRSKMKKCEIIHKNTKTCISYNFILANKRVCVSIHPVSIPVVCARRLFPRSLLRHKYSLLLMKVHLQATHWYLLWLQLQLITSLKLVAYLLLLLIWRGFHLSSHTRIKTLEKVCRNTQVLYEINLHNYCMKSPYDFKPSMLGSFPWNILYIFIQKNILIT